MEWAMVSIVRRCEEPVELCEDRSTTFMKCSGSKQIDKPRDESVHSALQNILRLLASVIFILDFKIQFVCLVAYFVNRVRQMRLFQSTCTSELNETTGLVNRRSDCALGNHPRYETQSFAFIANATHFSETFEGDSGIHSSDSSHVVVNN